MTPEAHGPVTVSELLQVQLEDERSLTLASAPAYVVERKLPGATSYAFAIDAPLDRRGLMDLLYVLAPYKAHGPDRFPRLLDNWALFERAKKDAGSARLMQDHAESLKFAWQEFAVHRPAFVDVMQDQSGERTLMPLLAWSRGEDGKRHWEFAPAEGLLEAFAGLLSSEAAERLDTVAGLVTVPYFLPELRKHWQAWLPLKRGGKSNYIGPASVPVVALMHRRALLNSALVQRVEAYAEISATRIPAQGS